MATTPSASNSQGSYLAQTEIAMEYAALRHRDHCPLGMYVLPSAESLLIWEAVLFVHQGAFMVDSREAHELRLIH